MNTTCLKPYSLSGEKASTSCFTGAYRAEHGHEHQPVLHALQQRAADDVGGDDPDEQHGDRRRDQPQAGHVAPEQARVDGRCEAIHQPEDPEERQHAGDHRDGHEEAGDEPPPKPVNHDRVRPGLQEQPDQRDGGERDPVPREHGQAVSDEIAAGNT